MYPLMFPIWLHLEQHFRKTGISKKLFNLLLHYYYYIYFNKALTQNYYQKKETPAVLGRTRQLTNGPKYWP